MVPGEQFAQASSHRGRTRRIVKRLKETCPGGHPSKQPEAPTLCDALWVWHKPGVDCLRLGDHLGFGLEDPHGVKQSLQTLLCKLVEALAHARREAHGKPTTARQIHRRIVPVARSPTWRRGGGGAGGGGGPWRFPSRNSRRCTPTRRTWRVLASTPNNRLRTAPSRQESVLILNPSGYTQLSLTTPSFLPPHPDFADYTQIFFATLGDFRPYPAIPHPAQTFLIILSIFSQLSEFSDNICHLPAMPYVSHGYSRNLDYARRTLTLPGTSCQCPALC